MLRPQRGNSEVSFNDTLLNFGLRPSYKSEYLFVIILIINIFKFSHTLCSLNDIMKAPQHPNPVNVHKMCLY